MRLLLDTHALIWIVREPHRVSKRAEALIRSEANEVWVSAVTASEIAIKLRLKKLQFDQAFLDDFDGTIAAQALLPLALTAAHAVAGARLPGTHKDPFDRLIAGQAITEGLTVVTADAAIAGLGARVVW